MREKVKHTIEEFHMFPRGARLIVGLSGGADSVALLHLLCALRQEFGWEVTAVHIHHGLRGAEADEDAAFAAAFSASLGVDCLVKQVDVRAEAKARGLGEEETGRILRYAAFREVAGADGLIAVAHHQRDQAETMLMRLCRGTGLTGLAAMAPVRGNLCRPLLGCSREEIEGYCRENGLSWREDATNREERYTRNKLRRRVLPVLEEINPQAVAHMAQTAALLSAEEDFLEQQAAACYKAAELPAPAGEVRLFRESLRQMHPAMRKRVLRRAMGVFLQQDVSQAQMEALEELLGKESGKSRDLFGGIRAENRYEALVLRKAPANAPAGYCYALPLGEEVIIPEGGIAVTAWLKEKNVEISEDACTKGFDYDKINQMIFCRTRQRGDHMRLKGGRKKIKELFIDEKIPRAEREAYPLIAMGQEVLWAPGLRLSEGLRADGQTEQVLFIRIRRVQA